MDDSTVTWLFYNYGVIPNKARTVLDIWRYMEEKFMSSTVYRFTSAGCWITTLDVPVRMVEEVVDYEVSRMAVNSNLGYKGVIITVKNKPKVQCDYRVLLEWTEKGK